MSAPIWFDSTETGAPVLNNAAGSLIALLRAVLVNGFNVRAITSIAVAGGVATVTCPAHGYSSAYGKWLEVRGASAPALNGVKQQTIVDANTFSYPAPGVADGTYTATDARRAPLGWVETFTNGGSTVSVFSRTAPEALAQQLRVNDSAASPATATSARLLMVRGATSVDAWAAQAPLETQLSGGLHCNKGANTTAAKQWVVVGNDRALWLFTADPAATNYILSLAFADVLPYRVGDSRGTLLSGTGTVASTSVGSSALLSNSLLTSPPSQFSAVAMASSAAVGDPVPAAASGFQSGTGVFGAAASSMSTDPDDFPMLRPVLCKDSLAGIRGEVPGLAHLLASHAVLPAVAGVVTDVAGAPWLGVRINNFSALGAALFSLSDDWY